MGFVYGQYMYLMVMQNFMDVVDFVTQTTDINMGNT